MKTYIKLLLAFSLMATTKNLFAQSDGFTTITNPVSLQQTDLAALRGNIGFQVQLAFFRLYSTYSISKYQAVTAGIGIGIGK